MGTLKGEPVNQKLDDIEDGIFKAHCYHCGHRQVKLVLMLETRRTHTYIAQCINPACFRCPKLEDMPSWVRA